MRRFVSAVTALFLSAPAIAHAQACFGRAAFANQPLHVGAGIDFGNGYTTFAGTLSYGKGATGLFATGAVGYASFDTFSGQSGLLVGGLAGYQLREDLIGSVRLCPVAGISHTGGVNETNFSAGMYGGYLANPTSKGPVKLYVTGGWQGVYQTYSTGGFGNAHEWYSFLDGGVGFVINERLTLSPLARVYLRYSGGRDPSLLLTASYALGNR